MIDPQEIESLKRLRRQKAAELRAAQDDDDDKATNWRRAQEFAQVAGAEGSEAFNVESEEQEGHFDEDGYFLFNDRQTPSECDVLKARREAKKRKLGIDDEDKFIAMKSQTHKVMKFKDKENPSDNEYSDEETPAAAGKDSWLAEIDEGRAGFKTEDDLQKLLKAKAEERSKQEARLGARYGMDMSDEDRLRSLIALLPNDTDTPAALLVRIKAEAVPEDQSMLSKKEQLKRKKGFQRPVKLNQDQQAAMNKLTELCDALVLNGIQVYEDTRRNLMDKLTQLGQRGKGISGEAVWEVKQSDGKTSLMSVTQARHFLAGLDLAEQRLVRLRQATREGDAISSLWIPGDMMEWQD